MLSKTCQVLVEYIKLPNSPQIARNYHACQVQPIDKNKRAKGAGGYLGLVEPIGSSTK